MVGIVDYGMGNIRSIQKALKRFGVDSVLSSEPEVLNFADRIILPGVGHFKEGMNRLKEAGLVDYIRQITLEDEKPLLGICLGFQLMTQHSEEGNVEGLGLIKGKTIKFPPISGLSGYKIPHIGWNTLDICKSGFLDQGMAKEYFYFVHSFCVQSDDTEIILSTSFYGIEFVSSIMKNNIIGMQFHPEKSHDQGMSLLKNFCSV